MRRILNAALLIAASATPVRAQQVNASVIDGVVSDSSLLPLVGASVAILGAEIVVVTGANGRFRIVGLRSGEYTLLARRIGFEAAVSRFRVAEAETLRVALALEPITTRLAAVSVTAKYTSQRIAEFLARRDRLQGQFMTQAEIERVNAVDAGELFSKFQYLGVKYGATGFDVSSGQGCMDILVDGFPSTPNYVPSPKAIAGIEVYLGPATIPPQYRSNRGSAGSF